MTTSDRAVQEESREAPDALARMITLKSVGDKEGSLFFLFSLHPGQVRSHEGEGKRGEKEAYPEYLGRDGPPVLRYGLIPPFPLDRFTEPKLRRIEVS